MAVARWDFRGGRQVPASGGALLAVNHLSHVDPIVLVSYCMAQGRVPRFLAMKELWGQTVVGAPLRGGRHIPVDRGASGIEAYRAAVEAVRQGEVVVVYPEGGFADHSDGWPRPARTGVARMALETGAPVIPVAQWGSNHLLPPTAKVGTLYPRATLRVLAGPPVALDGPARGTDRAHRPAGGHRPDHGPDHRAARGAASRGAAAGARGPGARRAGPAQPPAAASSTGTREITGAPHVRRARGADGAFGADGLARPRTHERRFRCIGCSESAVRFMPPACEHVEVPEHLDVLTCAKRT